MVGCREETPGDRSPSRSRRRYPRGLRYLESARARKSRSAYQTMVYLERSALAAPSTVVFSDLLVSGCRERIVASVAYSMASTAACLLQHSAVGRWGRRYAECHELRCDAAARRIAPGKAASTPAVWCGAVGTVRYVASRPAASTPSAVPRRVRPVRVRAVSRCSPQFRSLASVFPEAVLLPELAEAASPASPVVLIARKSLRRPLNVTATKDNSEYARLCSSRRCRRRRARSDTR